MYYCCFGYNGGVLPADHSQLDLDPTTRSWWTEAVSKNGLIFTNPYMDFATGKIYQHHIGCDCFIAKRTGWGSTVCKWQSAADYICKWYCFQGNSECSRQCYGITDNNTTVSGIEDNAENEWWDVCWDWLRICWIIKWVCIINVGGACPFFAKF